MEVAAAVVALVAAGLQSTKFICRRLRCIKDAPSAVARLVTTVDNLSKLLEQIKDLAESTELTPGQDNGDFFRDVSPLLRECEAELNRIEQKLGKINTASSPTWSKVKELFRQGSIEDMWKAVQQYVDALGLRLNYAGLSINKLNKRKLEYVGDTVTAFSSDVTRRLVGLETKCNENSNQAEANHQSLVSIMNRQNQELRSGRTEIKDFTDCCSTYFDQAARQRGDDQGRLIQAIDHVSNRIGDSTDMSARQYLTIQEQLQKLMGVFQDMRLNQQEKIQDVRENQEIIPTTTESPELCHRHKACTDGIRLSESLGRLCSVSTRRTGDVYSTEAQRIIHDLQEVIASFRGRANPEVSLPDEAADRPTPRQQWDGQDTIDRLNTILGASRMVHINNDGVLRPLKRSDHFPDAALSKSRCRSTVISGNSEGDASPLFMNDAAPPSNAILRKRRGPNSKVVSGRSLAALAPSHSRNPVFPTRLQPDQRQPPAKDALFSMRTLCGTVCVHTREQSSTILFSHGADPDADEDPTVETFEARMTFTPAFQPAAKSQMILSVSQTITRRSSISLTPMLSFRCVVPATSVIFDIVRYGSVRELQRILTDGDASLTDCDPDGRSLLNHALQSVRPSMVRFLLQRGADVDAIELDSVGLTTPLLGCFEFNEFETTVRERYLKSEYIKLLLAKGADASLPSNPFSETSVLDSPQFQPHFSIEITTCSLASFKAYLDLGSPFIGPNHTGSVLDCAESYPLLELAVSFSGIFGDSMDLANKFALLLTRGADANQKDSTGRNCLHYALRLHSRSRSSTWSEFKTEILDELKDILMLAITAGADIYAMAEDGDTPHLTARQMGLAEMWHEVLDSCFGIGQSYRESDLSFGSSSALENAQCSSRPQLIVSFQEYLHQRKAFCPAPEVYDFDWERAEREQMWSEGEEESQAAWSGEEEESQAAWSGEEEEIEAVWAWEEDDDNGHDDRGLVASSRDELKLE